MEEFNGICRRWEGSIYKESYNVLSLNSHTIHKTSVNEVTSLCTFLEKEKKKKKTFEEIFVRCFEVIKFSLTQKKEVKIKPLGKSCTSILIYVGSTSTENFCVVKNFFYSALNFQNIRPNHNLDIRYPITKDKFL